jgi:hypothetical protein
VISPAQVPERHAIVITHMGSEDRLLEMPWLEAAYEIDASDWVVLSPEGWRTAADGEATLWDALERKLLIGFYMNEPELIAVIGHPFGRSGPDPIAQGLEEVRRVVRRIGSLLLPTAVLGFWTDGEGLLTGVGESEELSAEGNNVVAPKGLAMARSGH